MNSTFKTCMCALALGLSGAAPLYAASATAACASGRTGVVAA